MTRSRRDLLAAAGRTAAAVGGAAAAGCLDFAAGDGPQGPEGTPSTLTCSDEAFVRLEAPFSESVRSRAVEASGTGFELSIEGASETYGQSLRLVLRNVGDAAAETAGEHAYSIQRQTTDGWTEIRGSTTGEAADLPRARETFEAGETYSWSITLTEDAIADAVPDRELDVCPPLGAGTHRFVYWGIADAPPVGVEFELVG